MEAQETLPALALMIRRMRQALDGPDFAEALLDAAEAWLILPAGFPADLFIRGMTEAYSGERE